VTQPQTLTAEYWVNSFSVVESDIEQINNHFLEVGKPQTAQQLVEVIFGYRVQEETDRISKLMEGRTIYQPKNNHEIGDKLLFPALQFAHGIVKSKREGYDPRFGQYDVISVKIKNKNREFASSLDGDHTLNFENGSSYDPLAEIDLRLLNETYGDAVTGALTDALLEREEFVRLVDLWFVKDLMADVNVGHLHLTEAVLEVNDGGPLPTEEIFVHLDLDKGLDPEVRVFSLNYALNEDTRFDEVGIPGKVAWFLKSMEPAGVQKVPERLQYEPISYDRALLSPQLLMLERELDDEWSDIDAADVPQPTILSLTYPHRWAGTLPLSSRVRPLLPPGASPRQRIILYDEHTETEIPAWVVQEKRYITSLQHWYEENNIPVGGFITLKPGPEPGIVLLGYDRRRPKREWVRLAKVIDTQLSFELERRRVGCGYDDLLIVGTDVIAAVDALARKVQKNQWSIGSILVHIFPALSKLNPQKTVHTKTLYSAINMLRRVPPGPLFAELIKHPAFRPVGDHYWQFDRSRSR
jgi:hypothetical protein